MQQNSSHLGVTIQTKQLLPVLIPGTSILLEASSDGYFVQHRGESFLEILYKDSLNPNSLPVLQPDLMHRLWNALRKLYEDGEDSIPFLNRDERKQFMGHFYSQEFKSRGAEVEDLEFTLQQLHGEMRYTRLFMNVLIVMRNDSGLVANLDGTTLPAAIQPVSVYTTTPIPLEDRTYGITLRKFKEAGGRIIAHGTSAAPPIFHEYAKEYEDIEAIRWMLGDCPVDGPSNTYEPTSLDRRIQEAGVLRGRKITKPANLP